MLQAWLGAVVPLWWWVWRWWVLIAVEAAVHAGKLLCMRLLTHMCFCAACRYLQLGRKRSENATTELRQKIYALLPVRCVAMGAG